MASILKKAVQLLVGSPSHHDADVLKMPKKSRRPFKSLTVRDLIKLESEIGSQLFGAVPAGNQREFFYLDDHTWIWYEQWIDIDTGKQMSSTTRYEVHEDSVLKVQEGARYSYLDGQELENFILATNIYYELVMRQIYKRDPQTRRKIV